MDDTDLVFALFDKAKTEVPMGTFSSYFDWVNALRALPPGLFLAETLIKVDNEVNNGGFDQYLLNTEGRFAKDAEAGMRRIGAVERAGLLNEAARVHDELGDSKKARSRLKELDSRYYACTEDLYALIARCFREHPDEFIP